MTDPKQTHVLVLVEKKKKKQQGQFASLIMIKSHLKINMDLSGYIPFSFDLGCYQ